MISLSQRVLTVLQFTRMALVFTAISNGWAAIFLNARVTGEPISLWYMFAMTVTSVGLYTFGMTLNDLIDRRRDSQIAPARPLPSGRISVTTAHMICILLALLAVAGGGWITLLNPNNWLSLVLVVWTLILICFYDFAGKYLVAPGLLALGLIRFFHATIPAPSLAIPWHPILLFVHVTLLSTVCYGLEGKRPRLTAIHWISVVGGAMLMLVLLMLFLFSRYPDVDWKTALWVTPRGLLSMVVGVSVFVVIAVMIRRRNKDPRAAGRTLMLYGLLWLIVYDALLVYGYVSWKHALLILAMLPISLLSVQLMRVWAKLVDLSVKPQYQRVR
jgi:4-hydroxybenzoate polyprenyltransferase